jgi:predicted house-cleaning NTP pyrophosphatase (Maf/HAM1 superfamily)
VTAVSVTDLWNGRQRTETDTARVHFHPFAPEEIEAILADGEIYHLAGGFSTSGPLWENHIRLVEGDIDTVIGIPRRLVRRMLQEAGYDSI